MKMLFFLLLIFSVLNLDCSQKPPSIPIIVYQLNDERKLRVFSFALKDFHDSPLMLDLSKSDFFSEIKEQWLNKLIAGAFFKGIIEDRGEVKCFYLQPSEKNAPDEVLKVGIPRKSTRLSNKN